MNKKQDKDTIKANIISEDVSEQGYFFPEEGVTIQATSLEEAKEKLNNLNK